VGLGLSYQLGGHILLDTQWESVSTPTQNTSWTSEYPEVIQRWAQARGFQSPHDFEKFLNFSLKDLKDPSLLHGMDKAVDRLIQAYEKAEKICLYADFDMDGTPGLALLIRGLQCCGFEHLLSFQPNRFDDGYGVHPEIIEDFIVNHNISLFVTVDVGITDVAAVEKANERGVDFIITDHHQAKEVLPPAYSIVNPNLENCTAGLNHLCGTGVAFYLVLALRREMSQRGILQKNFDPKKLLDCFAIATITDMVPLIEDNRSLVKHGLLQLARTDRVGLRVLMERLGLLGKHLSSSDIAIQLSPKLNALGRMNSEVQALDLFLETDSKKAVELVDKTLEAQLERTEVQRQAEALLMEQVSHLQKPHFVFQYSTDFYKGIVGLLATRMVENHGVPSFVGALMGDRIIGSARAPEGMNLLEGFEACREALNKFGGHKQAAGFELSVEKAPLFREKLTAFYQDQGPVERRLKYDFEAKLSELDSAFHFWLKKLEPFGMGFEPPILRLDHLFVASIRVLKEKHLKLTLKDMQGNKIEALWFFADNIDEKRQLTSKRVRVLVEPSINFYMGKESLQLIIRSLKLEY
jgi:single-stranded-DNA-specific exonuclease